MNADNIKLSPRLEAAASFVRRGSRILDVGTDHCHIPIWLLQNGICSRAAASDVVKGPLKKAEENLNAHGLTGRVHLRMADGLEGCETDLPDDILICGMGGELIADILSKSTYIMNSGVRLILQPMTKAAVLRAFLAGSGFEITEEKLVREDKRIYEVICAHYTGVKESYSPAECLVGKRSRTHPVFPDFFAHRKEYVLKRLKGIEASGKTESEEYREILALYNELNEIEGKPI